MKKLKKKKRKFYRYKTFLFKKKIGKHYFWFASYIRVKRAIPKAKLKKIAVKPKVKPKVLFPDISFSRNVVRKLSAGTIAYSLLTNKNVSVDRFFYNIPSLPKYYHNKWGFMSDNKKIVDISLKNRELIYYFFVYVYKGYRVKKDFIEKQKVYIGKKFFKTTRKISEMPVMFEKLLLSARKSEEYSKKKKSTKVKIEVLSTPKFIIGYHIIS